MLSTSHILLLQCQLLLLEKGIKEYSADWLENTNTVMRDAGGRFANKAKASIEETKSSLSKAVSEIRVDPTATQHRVESEFLKKTSQLLDKAVEKNPALVDKALSSMFGVDAKKSRDKLADIYGGINPGLPNAIKPDPLPTLVAEVKKNPVKAIVEGFEVAAHQYNKLIDDLNHVESDSEGIKLLGKLVATSIPIAGYLALTLTPEVALGLLFKQGIGTILADYAVGQVGAFAGATIVEKVLPVPYVEPVVAIVSLAFGTSTMRTGLKALFKKKVLPIKQIAKLSAVAESKEAALKLEAISKINPITFVKKQILAKNGKDAVKKMESLIADLEKMSSDEFLKHEEEMESFITIVYSQVKKGEITPEMATQIAEDIYRSKKNKMDGMMDDELLDYLNKKNADYIQYLNNQFPDLKM